MLALEAIQYLSLCESNKQIMSREMGLLVSINVLIKTGSPEERALATQIKQVKKKETTTQINLPTFLIKRTSRHQQQQHAQLHLHPHQYRNNPPSQKHRRQCASPWAPPTDRPQRERLLPEHSTQAAALSPSRALAALHRCLSR